MENKPSKAHHVFPAPEWTSLSASLAASLAHEIRNPLLSIKGAAQLLEQVVDGDDKTLANLIISEAARIEQLVATLDPLTPNPAQVSAVMNIHEMTEYVRLAARSFAPDISISTQYDPSLPEVRVVKEALVQALMNLVKNAVEAVADMSAPSITISTRYLLGERMQRPDGKKLPIELSVTDNGAGVAADVVGWLFTPFSSTKENGKGLGLAIVAKIIEEHGGLIAYDAPAAGGARFSVYLPVAS
jgi:two-component system nitrogen regulation sensor histidine kinase GlnL